MGLISSGLPSLYELWSDATSVVIKGASSTTAQTYSGIAIGNTSTPIWTFSCSGYTLDIDKIANNTRTHIRTMMASGAYKTAAVSIDTGSITSATKLRIASGMNSEDLYGYVLSGLRFPSFSEAIVDRILKKMAFSYDAKFYDPTVGAVYIADSALSSDPDDIYLQIGENTTTGFFSATRGGTPGTAILTSGSRAFWRHADSCYYLSLNGYNTLPVRVGSIIKLSLAA